MANRVLIYDGDCAYCRGFVKILKQFDRDDEIKVLGYNDEQAIELLKAQFGTKYGFSMYLFEAREVSWGKEAAKRIVEAHRLPKWLAKLAFEIYPYLVNFISKLTRRKQNVCGPECFETDDAKIKRMWTENRVKTQAVMARLIGSEQHDEAPVHSA